MIVTKLWEIFGLYTEDASESAFHPILYVYYSEDEPGEEGIALRRRRTKS